ncbi:hypothetical protein A2U01_0067587, partial [Trifolium medium]|nr:hypothetical protein [Trifolium medium]
SFHYENGSSRWKFIYQRRLALKNSIVGSVTEIIQATDVMTNAEASIPAQNVDPDTPEQAVIPGKEKSLDQGMIGNDTDDNAGVLSKSDENLETASEHIEKTVSADKN